MLALPYRVYVFAPIIYLDALNQAAKQLDSDVGGNLTFKPNFSNDRISLNWSGISTLITESNFNKLVTLTSSFPDAVYFKCSNGILTNPPLDLLNATNSNSPSTVIGDTWTLEKSLSALGLQIIHHDIPNK
jgi:hypothetical protein